MQQEFLAQERNGAINRERELKQVFQSLQEEQEEQEEEGKSKWKEVNGGRRI